MKKLWQRFKAGWKAWWIGPGPVNDVSQLDEWDGVGTRCPECGNRLRTHDGTVARCLRCGWKDEA
jgi:hypothetical protein